MIVISVEVIDSAHMNVEVSSLSTVFTILY